MNFLNNISIRIQILLLSSILVVMAGVLGVKAVLDERSSLEQAQIMFEGTTMALSDLSDAIDAFHRIRLRVLEANVFPDRRVAALNELPSMLKEFETVWQRYYDTLKISAAPGEREQADSIQQDLQAYRADIIQLANYANRERDESSTEIALRVIRSGEEIAGKITQVDDILTSMAGKRFEQQNVRAHQNIIFNTVLVVVVTIFALGAALIVSGRISFQLKDAVAAANDIAAKKLNRFIPQTSTRTEIGSLAKAFLDMQNSLGAVIGGMNTGSHQLAESVAEMAATTRQISQSSQQQTEAASSAAAAVQELTVSIDQVNDKADGTRQAAEHAREESEHSSEVIKKTSDQVQSIAETMQASVKLAEQLGERSQQIGVIVNTIRDIADQTNLLALNAAIEAARAGEQGRGFAVVADEVRKLAERTASSTEEIGQVINGIRDGIQTMVDNMKDSEAQVSDGVAMAEQARDAINNITRSSMHVLDLVGGIAEALREQSIASQQVAKNVEHIAQMAEENGSAILQVSSASEQLDHLAEKLNREVSAFQLR